MMFACRSFCGSKDHAGASRLRVDLDVVCFEGAHLAYTLALGVPMLLVYVIGFPACALFSVWRLRNRATKYQVPLGSLKGSKTWSLFYAAFRDGTWWWEGTTSARKVCLAMIGAFGGSMGAMQVPVTLLLVSMVALLTAMVRPYGDANYGPFIHRLEILSLTGLFMTLFAALVFTSYPKCKAEEDGAADLPWCVFFSVIVGCLDVVIVLVVIVAFLRLKGASKSLDGCLGGVQTRMRGMTGLLSTRLRRVLTFVESEESRQDRIRAETVENGAAQGNVVQCNPLQEAKADRAIEMPTL